MLLEDNNNKKKIHIHIYIYKRFEKNESGKQTRLGRTIILAPIYERNRFTIEKCQFSDVIGPRHAGGGCAVYLYIIIIYKFGTFKLLGPSEYRSTYNIIILFISFAFHKNDVSI